jgi:hypothetical protein
MLKECEMSNKWPLLRLLTIVCALLIAVGCGNGVENGGHNESMRQSPKQPKLIKRFQLADGTKVTIPARFANAQEFNRWVGGVDRTMATGGTVVTVQIDDKRFYVAPFFPYSGTPSLLAVVALQESKGLRVVMTNGAVPFYERAHICEEEVPSVVFSIPGDFLAEMPLQDFRNAIREQ